MPVARSSCCFLCTGGLSWRTAEIYGVDNFCALLGLVAAAWEEEEEEEE